MPHLFDYLYFVFGSNTFRKRMLIAPCLWLVIPIYQLIPNMYIGLPVALVICVLIPYLIIDRIYDRTGGRAHYVTNYFKNTKYDQFGWKALTFVAWVILWVVIPYILWKKGWLF